MVDEEMSSAVVAFIGTPGVLDAVAPEDRVPASLGDGALDLVPRIQALLAELDSVSPALWQTRDLGEMAKAVKRWLHANHPELDEAAVAALSSAYTFAWR